MDMLPLAMILAKNANRAQAFSAMPNAPVVPDVPRPARAARPRAALARVLERTAQAVAPRSATSCTPAH
jgi:hypothetical protein